MNTLTTIPPSIAGVALASTLLSPGAWAQAGTGPEMGRVISSIPVVQQVAVPRQVCTNEQVTVAGQKSGAGAVMGGIAGGAIGNQIGDGGGRAVATVLGVIGGAMLGDRIEGGGTPQTQTVQRCTTQTAYENQTVGYNVTYEYAGKQYTVQMPQDPGPWVRLQVTPVPSGPPPGTSYGTPHSQAPLGQGEFATFQPSTTITQETTYIVPATTYVAPPVYVPPRTVAPRTTVWVDVSPRPHHHHRPGYPGLQPGRHDDWRWR
jgi:uncharacterized protein YcfJ